MQTHSGFIASQGNNGYIQVDSDEFEIEFEYEINSILIETLDSDISIQLGEDEENLWHISANSLEGINRLRIKKIIVRNSSGALFRWKGLVA